jgi:hypothetical protein
MNLYEKIAAVMSDVAYLAKDDNVATGGGKSYKAISEEKVTSTVRTSLLKNKLVILPIAQEHKREDERITDSYGKEKINRITTVNVTYRIVNTEKPEEYIDVPSSGTGVDTQDKGVGKAMTYAYKYMLLRTFAIPTGDDADKLSSDLYDAGLYGEPTEKERRETDSKKANEINKGFDPGKTAMATEEQIEAIKAAAKEAKVDIMTTLKAKGKRSLHDLTYVEANGFIDLLNSKVEAV